MRLALSILVVLGLVAVGCSGGIECRGPGCGAPCEGPGCGPDGGAGDGDERACRGDQDCGGGSCVDGVCCPTAPCGGACCGPGAQCFAGACVTPGEACRTSRDCGAGRYCEPSLGMEPPGDLEDPVPDAPWCVHEPPPDGRCLDLPPVCGEGEDGADGHCLPRCEYHPPVEDLRAIQEWRWGPVATEEPERTDVWATPTVGRIVDANCDGAVDDMDPPDVVFVSGNAQGVCCSCGDYVPSTCLTGALRALDGATGEELWTLRRATDDSIGFAGLSVALGDLDGDRRMDVAAVTGEGNIVIVDGEGHVVRQSAQPIPGHGAGSFGWGGGLAIADMDGDGAPEIVYGASVFTTADGALTLVFTGEAGRGGGAAEALSVIANVDGDPDLELVAGKAAYDPDGTVLWQRPGLGDGFPAVADFDADGDPEVVLVAGGQVHVLEGATGTTELGPLALPGTGSGGPPTIADFDGDGAVEIGVAQANYYSVVEPDGAGGLHLLWQTANHDLSSSVTGSTVFDFEGDGIAEVIYNDECFLWVYDGPTGAIRFATPTTSFTATEASLVADVDGDGHAEMLMISNGANPGPGGWGCDVAPWNVDDPESVRPAWVPPEEGRAYRGITLWGDASSAWVGTRALWNEHGYHVSNVCDDHDDACDAPNVYGSIPTRERDNWSVPWLNNFRQNVQDEGIYDAPDATVVLDVSCDAPPVLTASVRNVGQALLPAGVEVVFTARDGDGADVLLGTAATDRPLFPGQVAQLTLPAEGRTSGDVFVARVQVDPEAPLFRQCRSDNDASDEVSAHCLF